ncbi:DNA adenine methylase [uncultured Methanomethylovorans sp.]|uniref:DNA adenine methylase n=1 Tax=uncultured Methanomethylovorans sp. TaxID=183759 RepID=UPI002AA90B6E|nr:DNA adenine methylase [uncultured Methanomethylovorans sp.]
MNLSVKTALRYPGGKTRALKEILPLIPIDIEEFRDPFVGGGSVFLAVKQTTNASIFRINDLNYDLYCFWKQVKDNNNELVKELLEIKKNSSDGRKLYSDLKYQSLEQSSEFEVAVRFFVLNRITFSGLSCSGGYSKQSFEKRFTVSSIERLNALSSIIQNVEITNKGYEKLINTNEDDVFIFLDPPYLNARNSKLYGNNGHLHTAFDHKTFAKRMKKCECRWLITCDDTPEIREMFDFAQIESWELQYGVNNMKKPDTSCKSKIGKELFIFNYNIKDK